jgi:hypothetical protein
MAESVLVLEGGVSEEAIPELQYYFDIRAEETIEAGCDITDQYVENNSAIQEHVALRPIEVTLTGFVGEKVYRHQDLYTSKFSGTFSKLNPIRSFVPPASSYAETVIGAASYVESSIRRYVENAKNITNIFSKDKTESKTRQGQVLSELISLRNARKLITVYIENIGKFENYLIKNVRMSQEDSVYQSRLIVELKQYNSVSTQTVALDVQKYKDRVAVQRAQEENLGKVQGVKENTSTLYRWTYGRGQ